MNRISGAPLWQLSILSCLLVTLAALHAFAEETLPINMLVPGFTVRELPVKLTNIDNLEYAADGRLFALGYDGRVHILTDTDSDGLEDTDKIYWSNSGGEFRGPVGMLVAPEGVYVSSKARVSLLRDAGGGVATKAEPVAIGWKEGFHNVDAVGVAKDADGNLFFGVGCANFANAYLVDKATGKSMYDIHDDHGTIQKVSAGGTKREIICSGIRFSISLKFNRYGDLFATDQEGATWCPGGNPVDKLIQIIPGRHYGFPPRHPEYLPNVVDEPNVCNFGPQHQSSCGMKFNEAKPGWKSFGPDFWEGDALVAGESRGKIYRCKLVKTPNGYVGSRPAIIACLKMLTIDVAVSPSGDMVVCCHSGPPDWGTGPKGNGRLFKISYTDPTAPQPVIAWAAGSSEVRVAFDKPLDPSVTSSVLELRAGAFVRAGDRYEALTPPYVAVKAQFSAGWRPVKVQSQKLSEDGRTLILTTEALPWLSNYALAIPGVKAPGAAGFGTTVDVDFDLTGAQAHGATQCWLPHCDPAISMALTQGSADHAAFGKSQGPYTIESRFAAAGKEAVIKGIPDHGAELKVQLANGTSALNLNWKEIPQSASVSYHTDADPNERPVRLEQLIQPWAAELPRQPVPDATNPYLLAPKSYPPNEFTAGGDWQKGHDLFFGEAKCAGCHSIHGEGGHFAPDLSNLVFRDPESVQRDIVDPNATINPDFVSYLVKLADGRMLTGLVQPAGEDEYRVAESAEKVTLVKKSDVREMRASPVSIMPQGFKELLGPQKLKDVLMFLTGEPPKKK